MLARLFIFLKRRISISSYYSSFAIIKTMPSRYNLSSHIWSYRRPLLLEHNTHETKHLVISPFSSSSSLSHLSLSCREDRDGIRLRIQILVNDVDTCTPIANAAVTMWHCDAGGIYSHYIQASQNVQNPQKDNSTFLRGIVLLALSLFSFQSSCLHM